MKSVVLAITLVLAATLPLNNVRAQDADAIDFEQQIDDLPDRKTLSGYEIELVAKDLEIVNKDWESYKAPDSAVNSIDGVGKAVLSLQDFDRIIDENRATTSAKQLQGIIEIRETAAYTLHTGLNSALVAYEASQSTGGSAGNPSFPKRNYGQIQWLVEAITDITNSGGRERVTTYIKPKYGEPLLSFMSKADYNQRGTNWQPYTHGQSMDTFNYVFKLRATATSEGCEFEVPVWDEPTRKEVFC